MNNTATYAHSHKLLTNTVLKSFLLTDAAAEVTIITRKVTQGE